MALFYGRNSDDWIGVKDESQDTNSVLEDRVFMKEEDSEDLSLPSIPCGQPINSDNDTSYKCNSDDQPASYDGELILISSDEEDDVEVDRNEVIEISDEEEVNMLAIPVEDEVVVVEDMEEENVVVNQQDVMNLMVQVLQRLADRIDDVSNALNQLVQRFADRIDDISNALNRLVQRADERNLPLATSTPRGRLFE